MAALVVVFLNAEDATGVGVVAVVGSFVCHIFKHQQAAGDADSKSQEIEERVGFAFREVADGDLEEAFEHGDVRWECFSPGK